MKTPINRVLFAFSSWDERKKVMGPLLKGDPSAESMMARSQLDHLRKAGHNLRQTIRADEQPFMFLLNKQIGRLERQLYPNLFLRILARLKDRLIDGPAYLQRQERSRDSNMISLKAQLQTAGLSAFAGRLEEHLTPEQKQVRIPLDCQLGPGQRLTYDLHFEKDAVQQFQLHSIDGALHRNDQLVRSQQFELADWPDLRSNQIWSLLEGRAMKQKYTDATGHQNQRWVELGAKGIQHYDPAHGFDIRAELNKLPITRNKEELITYLENGQLVPTHWKQGRDFLRIQVQADPAGKSLKLFDEQGRPTTAEKLNKQIAQLGPKVRTLGLGPRNTRKEVKNGIRH